MCVYPRPFEERRERREEEKSESAAVSSVATIEEAFHDESRNIAGRGSPAQRNTRLKSGAALFHCLSTQRLSFTSGSGA